MYPGVRKLHLTDRIMAMSVVLVRRQQNPKGDHEMRKRTVKATAMTILASGCMFQLGCLNLGGIFGQMIAGVPVYAALEWMTDNDGVFDLFEGGNVPVAE